MNRFVVAGAAASMLALLTLSTGGGVRASVAHAGLGRSHYHSITTGLSDDSVFALPGHAFRARWLARATDADVHWVRETVFWSEIAPAVRSRHFKPTDPGDPQYNWTRMDADLRDAAAARQRVLLQFLTAPVWALGRHPTPGSVSYSYRPDARAFRAFATAVAHRYSGRYPDPAVPGATLPKVVYYQMFNEPNLRTYISPQWARRRGRLQPYSPTLYRALLNAGYAAIKAVEPGAVIVLGGLAPYGDAPGVDRMHPLVFLRALLCLSSGLRRLPCPDPARFDIFSVDPYSISPSHSAYNPDDISVPDVGRARRVLDAAMRAHTMRPLGRKPIWVAEISWDSHPPDPYSRLSLAGQAHYAALALYEFWREGVDIAFWFQFRDAPYKSLTGSGLYFRSERAKPALAAFRFPFVVLRGRGGETVWGRAPRPGRVAIQLRQGRRWGYLRSVTATKNGIFLARWPNARRGTTLRAVQGPTFGAAWTVA